MPQRKKISRKKPVRVRRKAARNSRKGYNLAVPYAKVQSPIAERAFMKLRYVDAINLTITGGLLNNPVTFQSSLFAPRPSGGHQPLYYDQWTPMYTRYRVYGIKYHITFVNRATNECFWAGVRHQESATAETSLQTLLERGDAKMKMGTGTGAMKNTLVVKGYMSVAKTLGLAYTVVKNDDQFTAVVGANPTRMAYLPIYVTSNTASGLHVFEATVRLTYYCEMFDQVPVGAS